MANILAMNNILDLMKTPKDVNNAIVKRMRARNISLDSLIKIAFVLNCQEDSDGLFLFLIVFFCKVYCY